jgi:hypothetical protein
MLCQSTQIASIKKIALATGALAGLDIAAAVAHHDRAAQIKLPFFGKIE